MLISTESELIVVGVDLINDKSTYVPVIPELLLTKVYGVIFRH